MSIRASVSRVCPSWTRSATPFPCSRRPDANFQTPQISRDELARVAEGESGAERGFCEGLGSKMAEASQIAPNSKARALAPRFPHLRGHARVFDDFVRLHYERPGAHGAAVSPELDARNLSLCPKNLDFSLV
jgi:hypothetical protein